MNGDRDPRWIEAWCYIYLGKIYDILGQRQRAMAEYTKAVNTKDDTYGAQAEAQKWLAAPFTRERTTIECGEKAVGINPRRCSRVRPRRTTIILSVDPMTSWKQFAQKTRVPAGTVLGILFLLLMHPSVRSLWIGAAITLPGCLLRFWAAGHIDKGKALTQGGPYAMTRNPLYLGSFLMALGIILGGQGYWLLPLFGALLRGLLHPGYESRSGLSARRVWSGICRIFKKSPGLFPRLSKSRCRRIHLSLVESGPESGAPQRRRVGCRRSHPCRQIPLPVVPS